jgi:hypothetical protein
VTPRTEPTSSSPREVHPSVPTVKPDNLRHQERPPSSPHSLARCNVVTPTERRAVTPDCPPLPFSLEAPMNGSIEEVHLRRPLCDECGPIAPLRDCPLSECETALEQHYHDEHDGPAPGGYDA